MLSQLQTVAECVFEAAPSNRIAPSVVARTHPISLELEVTQNVEDLVDQPKQLWTPQAVGCRVAIHNTHESVMQSNFILS